MLILTRKIGESLIIDDKIVVTVLNIRNNQIRFGISAPKDIPVHREEVYRRIELEKNKRKTEKPYPMAKLSFKQRQVG